MASINKLSLFEEQIQTYDNFIANVKINEKYLNFFLNFVDIESETQGNLVKSFHKAGYPENKDSLNRARKMYNSPLIQRLLTLWNKKQQEKKENDNISVFDKADNALIWAEEAAKSKCDYMGVRAIAMDRAKLHGILVDKHQVVNHFEEQALTESKRKAALELAKSRLLPDHTEDTDDIIDADFEADSDFDSVLDD